MRNVRHAGSDFTPKVRAGWAAASRELSEAGDDALVWPEFSNAGDDQLRWTKAPRRNPGQRPK
jgi:hypothetical protein